MGRARFMVYPWFFFRFVCDQSQAFTRPSFESRNLWCLLAKSCWNITDWKFYEYSTLHLVKNISPFCVIEALDLKWVLNTQKAITSFMKCVDAATFSWAACWLRSCLFQTFISPGAINSDLTVIFRVFFVFFRQEKSVVVLFYGSEFRDRKEN